MGTGLVGSVLGKHLFYRKTRGTRLGGSPCGTGCKWAHDTCAGCPQQRYATGEPGKVQGRDRVGIIEVSCGYRARWVSVRGKFVLSRNSWYKTRGVAMWLNVVLTSG